MYEDILTKDFLEEQYIKQKKSKAQLAREIKCSVHTLNSYLDSFGIKKQNIYDNKNLSGKRFGRLLVLSLTHRDKHQKRHYLCRCDCGVEKTIAGSALRRNLTLSCGCLRHEKLHTGYKDLSSSRWRRIKEQAFSRGIEFDVTQEYIWSIFEQQKRKCKFTGVDITFHCDSNKPNEQTASIDRIDSNIGYIEGNIQIIHKSINLMKSFLEEKEFLSWCNLIALKNPVIEQECYENIKRTVLRKEKLI